MLGNLFDVDHFGVPGRLVRFMLGLRLFCRIIGRILVGREAGQIHLRLLERILQHWLRLWVLHQENLGLVRDAGHCANLGVPLVLASNLLIRRA